MTTTTTAYQAADGQRRRALLTLWQAFAAGAALSACGGGGSQASQPEQIVGPDWQPAGPPGPSVGSLAVSTHAQGLQNPWGLAFLPDARALVTERPGRLRIVSVDGKTLSPPVSGVPAVLSAGQGGLLDVAVQEEGGDTWVYLSYSEAGSGAQAGTNGTAVARGRLVGTALLDVQVIFRQTPKVANAVSTQHFGSRLVLAPGGLLFITLGERAATSERVKAQDLSTHHGKVVRIRTDGSVPGDNPFVGTPNARPEIWSFGHRNPQGAALRPATGELWVTEHGPQGGDELNLIQRGANYGWPLISYGCEYGSPVGNCTPVGGASSAPGLQQPVTYWVPVSIAPSGLCWYSGSVFPEWQGQLFMGALAGQALWRLEFDGNALVRREEMFKSLGERIRDVRQGPDGALYLLTDSGSGRVLRVAR
jgi:glucose/arabinose dehydrogenase